jgi:hypothetical protein
VQLGEDKAAWKYTGAKQLRELIKVRQAKKVGFAGAVVACTGQLVANLSGAFAP